MSTTTSTSGPDASISWTFSSTIQVSGLTFSFDHVDAYLGGTSSLGRSGTGNMTVTVGYSTSYSYSVTAVYKRSGHSDQTITDSGGGTTGARPLPPAPGALTSFSAATGGSGEIVVTAGTPSSNVAGVEIVRDGTTGFSQGASPSSSATFHDTGLSPGSGHSYTGRAYNFDGYNTVFGPTSSTSGTAGGTPPIIPGQPTLSGYDAGGGNVSLSWSAASNASYYIVSSNNHGSNTTTSTSYSFNIGYSTTDTFQVTAVSSTGNSGTPSNSVTVTTGPAGTPPSAPGSTTVSASTGAPGAIGVSWTASSGASGYRLYRDGAQILDTTSLSTTVSGLAEGSSHSFYVIPYASNAYGSTNGPQSNTASANAGTTPPPAASIPDSCGVLIC